MSALSPASDELSNRALLRWMFGFLRPVRWLAAITCIYLTLFIAAEVAAVRTAANAVDRIKNLQVAGNTATSAPAVAESTATGAPAALPAGGWWAWVLSGSPAAVGLRNTVLLLAVCTACLCVLTFLREVANSRLSMEMVFHIRAAVYDKLQRVGFGFHDNMSTGELINRALSDLQNVREFVRTAVIVSLEIVLVVCFYFAVLVSRSPWVALLALAPLPVWTWWIMRFGKRAQPAWKGVMEVGDKNIELIAENIAGVHVVRAFATEQQEIKKYQSNLDEFFHRVISRIRMFANFIPVMRGIAHVANLTLFLLASVIIIRSQGQTLSVGDLMLLGAAMGALLGRLQQISMVSDQYQSAIVSSRRLHEVLHSPPSVAERPAAQPLPDGPGAVRFEHVTFGYRPDKPVLHDVNFEIEGGKVVAVVGPTGCGKTTLAALIARFYDPQQGRILIDGVDIRDVTLDSLHSQIAYVFQETYLFSESVEANIAYGRPYVKGGAVQAAARLAQAHEFVRTLPRGYETPVGERGTTLSGGQRQRVAIARALLAGPRILILDDATAAIDPETEDGIRRAVRFATIDCTTFVIAHRISTVKNADLVLVLEEGRITQMGTHAELVGRPGHYRDIVNLQVFGDTSEDSDERHRSHLHRMRNLRREQTQPARVEEFARDPLF